LQEAISLATAATSLRLAPPPPVSDLLHYGAPAGLRGLVSSSCPTGWVYPAASTPSRGAAGGGYGLQGHQVKGHQVDVKNVAGFPSSHQIREGKQPLFQ